MKRKRRSFKNPIMTRKDWINFLRNKRNIMKSVLNFISEFKCIRHQYKDTRSFLKDLWLDDYICNLLANSNVNLRSISAKPPYGVYSTYLIYGLMYDHDDIIKIHNNMKYNDKITLTSAYGVDISVQRKDFDSVVCNLAYSRDMCMETQELLNIGKLI